VKRRWPLLEELTEKEKIAIANRYKPLLVLYPEIESNSERKDHHHKDYGPGRPPLDQDYHPRGIELALDHAFARRVPKHPELRRSEILDAMSSNDVDLIDILKDAGPGDVAKFWRTYAAIPQQERDERYPRKAYARIVLGFGRYAGYLVIQYWLAYFFDDWANVHEMDWEMVSVVLRRADEKVTPVGCAYGVHMGGFRLPWPEVEKVDDGKNPSEDGTHPVAYVANGSHASYFYYSPKHEAIAAFLGRRLSARLSKQIMKRFRWIKNTFDDYVPSFAEGEKHFPEVEMIPDPDPQGHWHGDWRWLNFKGKWGSKGKLGLRQLLTLPWEEDGPTGPNQKGHWEDPFTWIDWVCHNAGSWIRSR
jgi:hypothetical protein